MTERAEILRARAVEFRRLAKTNGNSADLTERLIGLADQCDRLAADIERGMTSPPSSSRYRPSASEPS